MLKQRRKDPWKGSTQLALEGRGAHLTPPMPRIHPVTISFGPHVFAEEVMVYTLLSYIQTQSREHFLKL